VAVEAATGQFLSVAQRDHELTVIAGLELFYLAYIHDERTMDTKELRGIEFVCHSPD
jgi:hypothetical protein